MAEPIPVTVIRAWDGMVITAWWDKPIEEKQPWLNIRRFRSVERSSIGEVTLRFSPEEVVKLVDVIRYNTSGAPENG